MFRFAPADRHCLLALALICASGDTGYADKKVGSATGKLPLLPAINIDDPDRFLNDLKLSPLWKVEKDRSGSFVAKARSVNPGSRFEAAAREFLFELMGKADKTLPKDFRICDSYLEGGELFTCFSVEVVFQKPKSSGVVFGESGQEIVLGIHESFENQIGPNSTSDLTIQLSSKHDIYVVLHEQGSDPTRGTTFAKAPLVLSELADIAGSPKQYRVEDRYAEFFKLFFPGPLKNQDLRRFPGIQDRDTFCGYLRTRPDTSYGGINIKVSHPVFCPEEGTRKHSRLEKAEYLGNPHFAGDVLFFLIEDNAVYLSGEYDQRFGTFTGKESFDGVLEVLNDQGDVLLKTTEKFKAWQR